MDDELIRVMMGEGCVLPRRYFFARVNGRKITGAAFDAYVSNPTYDGASVFLDARLLECDWSARFDLLMMVARQAGATS